MSDRYYSGVGARKTPAKIQDIMTAVAHKMDRMGFTLRSGGAEGADYAFEWGARKKTIYYASDATEATMLMASIYHPAWKSMGEYAQKLHGRNVLQVFGHDFTTPSELLICWTPDGCTHHNERTRSTGGTGTAISIASMHNIPVFNLKREEDKEKILQWLK